MAAAAPLPLADRVGSWMPRPVAPSGGSASWVLAIVLAGLIVAWAMTNLLVEQLGFVVHVPRTQVTGVEVASALARLFAALVLLMFPDDRVGPRLRWVAAGFVILGLGALRFSYLEPLLGEGPDLTMSMYAFLFVWGLAGACFAIGLALARAPRLGLRTVLIGLMVIGGLSIAIDAGADRLPTLVTVADIEATARTEHTMLPGLTGWHWTLSALPLGLALVALAGAALRLPDAPLRGWLVVAMVLLAGSQVHSLFWPSAYYPILTTSNLLRFAFSAVVAVGAVVELRRIAAERAVRLAAEQEYAQRLSELVALRNDFTAMVAHELSSPVAAIRGWLDVMDTGTLSPDERTQALATIRSEIALVNALVADVRAIATIERDDFAIKPIPVQADLLLADSAAFARSLFGAHPLSWTTIGPVRVRADPERIGQVLRNLMSNAAKYSPPGTPIELRGMHRDGRVRIEVVDQGFGIHSEDVTRIFEKFGRGRDAQGRHIAGAGLGLYLSRRIVLAHGSDLRVHSVPGSGSTFWFELEVVR